MKRLHTTWSTVQYSRHTIFSMDISYDNRIRSIIWQASASHIWYKVEDLFCSLHMNLSFTRKFFNLMVEMVETKEILVAMKDILVAMNEF